MRDQFELDNQDLKQAKEEGKKNELKSFLIWLNSFKERAIKYYKFQNFEYNQKIEKKIKEIEGRLKDEVNEHGKKHG